MTESRSHIEGRLQDAVGPDARVKISWDSGRSGWHVEIACLTHWDVQPRPPRFPGRRFKVAVLGRADALQQWREHVAAVHGPTDTPETPRS